MPRPHPRTAYPLRHEAMTTYEIHTAEGWVRLTMPERTDALFVPGFSFRKLRAPDNSEFKVETSRERKR